VNSRNTPLHKVIGISVMGFALVVGVTSATASIAAADPVSVAATNIVRACVKDSGGAIRHETSATKKCRSGEYLVTWNRRGATGAKGLTGPRGLNGLVGERGEKGEVGEKGEKGDTGPIGLTGAQGATGSAGPQGAAGASGAAGTAGTAGAAGAAGVSGYVTNANGLFGVAANTAIEVFCPGTTKPVGGGFALGNAAGQAVSQSRPMITSTPGASGWTVKTAIGSTTGEVTAYVMCAEV
jgi:hypothetical protein